MAEKHIDIAGATSIKCTAREAANYDLIVTNSSGCSTVSANTKVTKSCFVSAAGEEVASSAKTNSTIEILLYPNPANGPVPVSYKSDTNRRIVINVYDIAGRIVFSNTLDAKQGRNVFNINLASLLSGSYFFELNAGSQQARVNFMIE